MAAIINSTPSKFLRGIYNNALSHSQSFESAIDGVTSIVTQGLVSTTPTEVENEIDMKDFEAW
jgi:hypothetical protein